jgi:hypothetical protein
MFLESLNQRSSEHELILIQVLADYVLALTQLLGIVRQRCLNIIELYETYSQIVLHQLKTIEQVVEQSLTNASSSLNGPFNLSAASISSEVKRTL